MTALEYERERLIRLAEEALLRESYNTVEALTEQIAEVTQQINKTRTYKTRIR